MIDTRNRDYIDTFVQGIEGLCRTMYHGLFWYDSDRDDLIGEMEDRIGHSKIYVALSTEQLSFFKKYDGSKGSDFHQHIFNKKNGDWWVGKFITPSGEMGESRCIVMEISPDILAPSPKTIQGALAEIALFRQQEEVDCNPISSKVNKEICLKILKRGLMRDIPSPKSEFAERAELIEMILDRIKPIPKNAPEDVAGVINVERQILVLRAGWNSMPIEELRRLIKEG